MYTIRDYQRVAKRFKDWARKRPISKTQWEDLMHAVDMIKARIYEDTFTGTHDFSDMKSEDSENTKMIKCHGCGAYFPVPGVIHHNLCVSCENLALRRQQDQCHEHLIGIRDKLNQIHQHPEWTVERVRMEIYSIIIYNF